MAPSSKSHDVEKSDREKVDKSLDEVSNVIHDLLTDPVETDTEEKIDEVFSRSDQKVAKTPPEKRAEGREIPDGVVRSLLESGTSDKKRTFDEFIDERTLISRDAFGKKEMKIKVIEVSDEKAPTVWKLGDRVKVTKILITIKHLGTQEIEEAEFDIESIEKELAEKRHYTSTNRWVPTGDVKNGYVIASRHTSLVSDAVALDYIIF